MHELCIFLLNSSGKSDFWGESRWMERSGAVEGGCLWAARAPGRRWGTAVNRTERGPRGHRRNGGSWRFRVLIPAVSSCGLSTLPKSPNFILETQPAVHRFWRSETKMRSWKTQLCAGTNFCQHLLFLVSPPFAPEGSGKCGNTRQSVRPHAPCLGWENHTEEELRAAREKGSHWGQNGPDGSFILILTTSLIKKKIKINMFLWLKKKSNQAGASEINNKNSSWSPFNPTRVSREKHSDQSPWVLF